MIEAILTIAVCFGIIYLIRRGILKDRIAASEARTNLEEVNHLKDAQFRKSITSNQYQANADLPDCAKSDSQPFIIEKNTPERWEALGYLFANIVIIFLVILVSAVFVAAVRITLRRIEASQGLQELNIFFFLVWKSIQISCRLVVHYLVIKSMIGWRQRSVVKGLKLISERPTERPILYLRSFIDDRRGAQVVGRSTEEEQLAFALNDIGPFITIGRPGEDVPQVGAGRIYVKPDRWMEVVEDFMSEAQLVIMRIGRSEGFWWEFRKAVEKVSPERLVILVPSNKALYEEFQVAVEKILPVRLPPYRLDTRDYGVVGRSFYWIFFKLFPQVGNTGSLKGLLYFDADWTPSFAKFRLTLRGTLKAPGSAAIVIALQRPLSNLGLSLPIPKIGKSRIALLAISICLIYGYLVLLSIQLSILVE